MPRGGYLSRRSVNSNTAASPPAAPSNPMCWWRSSGRAMHRCLAGLAGTTLFFRNYYAAIPKELVNAARMDGASFFQIFWRILRPTPLLLQYRAGDYNCLHQDLYGEHVFPLQAAVLLSQPGVDYLGGEFVLTEQRPRMQSRAEVVPLEQGGMVIFPVFHRPVSGTRGVYRVNMRHGVSRLRSGARHTMGIIFHDAA
eukprot:gene28144-34957_t